MIKHMLNVESDAPIYQLSNANVYRTPFVPAEQTGGIGVDAASDNLPRVVGTTLASGHFLGAVSQRYPEVVLGAQAAATLQINHVGGHVMVYIGNRWFVVVGILKPGQARLVARLGRVHLAAGRREDCSRQLPEPSEIYVRSSQNDVTAVANLLPATANPQDPSGVSVDRPSDVLEARAAAKGQFTTLLLGLGAVALLVGAIGIANIMVISVLERRGEIGLRRALGATRGHISLQFLAESALLAAIGGVFGLAIGAGATEVYAAAKHEPFVVPLYALIAAPTRRLPDRRARGPVPGGQGRPAQPDRGAAARTHAVAALTSAPTARSPALAATCSYA